MTGDPSGPRYDQRATTPFAGVVFKVRPDLSLYASYVEGLSQGDTAPTSAAITNPGETLPPFKSKQKEIGAKYNLNDDMLATVSLFELTRPSRSEEHTSELQSLMRISYAVFCLKKKTSKKHTNTHTRK